MPVELQSLDYAYVFPSEIQTEGGAVSLRWADSDGAFGHSRPLALNRSLATVRCRPGAFSPEECQAIVALGEAVPTERARTEVAPETYRVGRIAPIDPSPANHWLFHKLALLFAEANRDYDVELTGFAESLQYTLYGPEQHFNWHIDVGSGQTSARKLSMTVQLSPPDAYTGGDLEFIGTWVGAQARELGAATFFPSYLGHRVAAVRSGLRRSLVAWAYGPAFR